MSKAVNRAIMKSAGRTRTISRNVTVQIGLDVVVSGAAVNNKVGSMQVFFEGVPQDLNDYRIIPVSMSNGQFKWAGTTGFDLLTTDVPTDINVSNQGICWGLLQHKKTFETVVWSVMISIVSAIENYTLNVPMLGKIKVNSAGVAALIAQCPVGNNVTIQRSALSAIELTSGPMYVLGTNVMPGPSDAYKATGVEDKGYDSWLEDGNVRTKTPYFSEAQGNGVGALGVETLTTAKPALKMSTVWRQAFSGKLLLCFEGESLNTSGDTVGLSKVRVYAEGSYFDITQYQSVQIVGPNGEPQWLYGMFVEIDALNYIGYGTDRTRGIHIYARGWSADGTQQTQLIGGTGTERDRYLFFPMAAGKEHDYLVRIDPDQVATINLTSVPYPGVWATFKNYEDAEKYLIGTTVGGQNIGTNNKALRPRVEYMKEGGLLNPVNTPTNYGGARGFLTLCAGPSVTTFDIGRVDWDFTRLVSGIYNIQWKPAWGGIEFRGKAIKHNFDFYHGIAINDDTMPRHWANGCEGKCSFDNWKEMNSLGLITAPSGFSFQTFTNNMNNVNVQGMLVGINNKRKGMSGDYATSAAHLVGEQCDFWGCDVFRNTLPYMRVKYKGTDPGAYWYKTADPGVSSGIFYLVSTDATYSVALASNATRGMLPQDLIDWVATINPALWEVERLFTPGDKYTARAPKYLQDVKVFCPINTWSANAVTRIEIHQDFNAGANGKNHQNQILRRIRLYEVDTTQFDFLDGNFTSVVKDSVWLDNNPIGVKSQYTAQSYSRNHYMALGNMDIRSNYAFRNSGTSQNPFNPTTWNIRSNDYTWIKGCIFNKFAWDAPSTSLVKPNCMANFAPGGDDGVNHPQVRLKQVSGTTINDIYPFRKTKKDLRPSGALMSPANFDVACSKIDAQGIWRKASGPVGPTVRGLDDGVITGAQLRELAAVSCTNDTGANVASLAITFKTGAGNTGPTKTAVIQFDVAA